MKSAQVRNLLSYTLVAGALKNKARNMVSPALVLSNMRSANFTALGFGA
jgi:hypothetical protein